MDSFVFVYMTMADAAEAERIGRALLEAQVAACVNALPAMRSQYWWKGKIESAEECVLIAKTRCDLVPALTEKVRRLHSYECPCVVAMPIVAGNSAYLAWLGENVRPEETPS